MTEELNKKLAEWAGFTCGYWELNNQELWVAPNELPPESVKLGEEGDYECPDFTNDLNACFKWLVPKLNKQHSWIILQQHSFKSEWICQIWYKPPKPAKYPTNQAVVEAETPALALCKAIEKLIDSEVE